MAHTTATNVLLAILGLASGLLAARLLGPEGRGELAAIQLWTSLLMTFASLGLAEALVFRLGRSPSEAPTHLATCMAVAGAAVVPFLLAGGLVVPWLMRGYDATVVSVALLYLLMIPLNSVMGIHHAVLRGQGRFRAWNVLRLLPPLAWLAVLLFAFAAGLASPEFVALANLGAFAVLVPLYTTLGWRAASSGAGRQGGPGRATLREPRSYLKFGLPSIMATVPTLFAARLDQVVIAVTLPSASLGLYVVAVAWGAMSGLLLQAVGSVLFPYVASQHQATKQAAALGRTVRGAVLLGGGVGLGLVLTAPLIPLAFGAPFAGAVVPAQLLAVGLAVAGVNGVLAEGSRGLGRPGLAFWGEVAGLACTAATLFVLLPLAGLVGAAAAPLVGYSVTLLVLVVRLRRLLPGALHFRPGASDVLAMAAQLKSLATMGGSRL